MKETIQTVYNYSHLLIQNILPLRLKITYDNSDLSYIFNEHFQLSF